jgi:hypothetical protein
MELGISLIEMYLGKTLKASIVMDGGVMDKD